MMRPDRKNGGFTLVELIVTFAVASLVTLSALSVMLFGMRINKQSTEVVGDQYTTRILLSALEDMATEGIITGVEIAPERWKVLTTEEVEGQTTEKVLFSYDAAKQTIYSGDSTGTPFLEGVVSSYAELDDQLLTISVETSEGIFNSSIYCRTASIYASGSTGSNGTGEEDDGKAGEIVDKWNDDIPANDSTVSGDNSAARTAFLKKLASQYNSTGYIVGTDPKVYFSEWYCGGSYWPGWNQQTPWCACFVSWGMDQVSGTLKYVPKQANVGKLMAEFTGSYWQDSKAYEGTYTPIPGDLIFFDWIVNSEVKPQHVGAVLLVSGDYVYTIEGNSSGKVAVRKYAIDDKRILGYGILNWKE